MLSDALRQAAQERAFECYSLGLYGTALSLMEAVQDEHADQIAQLNLISTRADLYMQRIRGGDNEYTSLSAGEAPAFRSLKDGDVAAGTPGPHASTSPVDWTIGGEPALLQHILLSMAAAGQGGDRTGQHRSVFTAWPLVCKAWNNALKENGHENNPAWRKAFFAHVFGLAWGSEIEKGHLQEEVHGYWRAQYKEKLFMKDVSNYDTLVTQAAKEANPAVIQVVHVRNLINQMCNIAEKVAVAAPTQVPQEACVPIRTRVLAHKVFLAVKAACNKNNVVIAVTDIWEASITQTIGLIVTKLQDPLQDFSSEHKQRACVFIDKFIEGSTRWLVHYIDNCSVIVQLNRPATCAGIGKREAQRLRTLLLPPP